MSNPNKPPREGTRARAVYDLLKTDYIDGCASSWSELKAEYDYAAGHIMLDRNQRKYSGQNVGRLLQKYATRVSRGFYSLKTTLEQFQTQKTEPKVVVPTGSWTKDVVEKFNGPDAAKHWKNQRQLPVIEPENVAAIHKRLDTQAEHVNVLEIKTSYKIECLEKRVQKLERIINSMSRSFTEDVPF